MNPHPDKEAHGGGAVTEEDALAYAALIRMEAELDTLNSQFEALQRRIEWKRHALEQQAKACGVEAITPERKMNLNKALRHLAQPRKKEAEL